MSEAQAAEPAQFYTGLVADLYGPLKSSTFDPAPFATLIRRYGEPALELGCGDGHPLLALVADGLHVEGLDSSIDMLDRCRRSAESQGREVVLHHSTMETMDLGRHYRTIYLAGPTFNLLVSDDAAQQALRRIAAHLLPDGVALVPLFVPSPTPVETFGRHRVSVSEDGSLMRFSVLSEVWDDAARTQTAQVRYELVVDDAVVESVDRSWILHWHAPGGFAELVANAGLEVVWVRSSDRSPVTDASTEFSFLVRRRTLL
jgi:SAM-dependent methyltransferase